jgi:hypothetical protein
MNWFHTGGSQKSESEVTHLAQEVIGASDFKPEDLAGFSTNQENKQLDDAQPTARNATPFSDDDWREVSIEIDIPVPMKGLPPQSSKFLDSIINQLSKSSRPHLEPFPLFPFISHHLNGFMSVQQERKLAFMMKSIQLKPLKLLITISRSSRMNLAVHWKRSSQVSCSGWILLTSQILAPQVSGHFTCTMPIFQNISTPSPILEPVIV